MNELATKAANGTMSSSDRNDVHNELKQLSIEIDRVATTTKFNETYLLNGTGKSSVNSWNAALSFSLQVGADNKTDNRISVEIFSITASAIGVGVNDSYPAKDIIEKYHYGLNDAGSVIKIGTAVADSTLLAGGDFTVGAGSILPIGGKSNQTAATSRLRPHLPHVPQ